MPRPRPLAPVCAFTLSLLASAGCDRFTEKEAAPAPSSEPAPAEEAKAETKDAAKAEVAKAAPTEAPATKEEPPAPAPTTAKAAPRELIGYVPQAATLVLVADPKAIARSSLFSGSGAFLDKLGDSRIGEVHAAMTTCKVGVETWSSLLVAGDGESKNALVLALRASGVGKKDTVQCIADGVNAKSESGKWTVSEEAGRVVFEVEGGKARGIGAADDVLLVVGSDYTSAVTSILDGEGKSAADGSLGKLVAGVDHSRHVYFAGHPPVALSQGPLADVQHVSGTLDFSSGLALALSIEYHDLAKAEVSAQTLRQMLEVARDPASKLEIPAGLLASVKIDVSGKAVSARASASKADLEAIAAGMGGQF